MNKASWLARLVSLALPTVSGIAYGYKPGIGWVEVAEGSGSTGEANTQPNVGDGVPLGKPKLGTALPLKTLLVEPGIELVEAENTVTIKFKPSEARPLIVNPVSLWSTTTKTIALTDASIYLRAINAGASTLTVPTDAAVNFPIGTEIGLRRASMANLTIAPAAGVIINAPANGTLIMTNRMSAMLKKVATNEWDLVGQTVPA